MCPSLLSFNGLVSPFYFRLLAPFWSFVFSLLSFSLCDFRKFVYSFLVTELSYFCNLILRFQYVNVLLVVPGRVELPTSTLSV